MRLVRGWIALLRKVAFAFVAFQLSGCTAFNDVDAFGNCVDLIEQNFPEAAGLSSKNFDEDAISGIAEPSPDGSFEFRVSNADGSTYLACYGNSERREIYELEFQGEKASPDQNASWSY